MKTFPLILIAVAVCALAFFLSCSYADDYWSPVAAPGTDAAKMKTLDQVEPRQIISQLPYIITNSGSYYLSTTLYCSSTNGSGIIILSDDVKLDMNGFALNGITNSFDGITVPPPIRQNITILNGVVRGWQGYGINGTNAANAIIENVKAYVNGLGGIIAGQNSLLENCISYGNGMYPQAGVINDGIHVLAYSTVKDCKSFGNMGAGIYASFGSKVSGCTAAQSLQANGIFAEDYCTIRDCTVMGNMNGGITILNNCRVTENTCGANNININSAGILVMGGGNRIEDNNVTGNFNGIMTTVPGNLVVRNTANSNTNAYPLSSGDKYGQIAQPPAGSFSNVSPWANFSF